MSIPGIHLTQIGSGDFLLEPSRSLNIRERETLIEQIAGHLLCARGSYLYYDLSDQALIDPVYYDWLTSLARAMRVINVGMVCIHMQPTAAFALAQFVQTPPVFATALDIASWQKMGQRA